MSTTVIDSSGGGGAAWASLDRWLGCIAVFAVAASLIGLVTTLAGNFYALPVALVSVLVAGLYDYAMQRRGVGLPGAVPRWRHVLLLILVALPLRVPAYHYVMGGQDEGLYVNIAHYIERTGGIEVHDGIRQSLQGTRYLDRYDANNHVGTSYVAGVYKDGRDSRLQFQFYDLFPVWMALFGGMLGAAASVYAQTFFGLFSIVLFYRLTLLLTGRHRAALVSGGLLALSPLHVFFSKFPVTEIPTLCFSLLGFLLLAGYCSAVPDERRGSWLLLSGLAFLCVFTTRISGFMYLPFVIGLAWVATLLDRDPPRKWHLQHWAIGVTAAYLLSVLYGLIWSTHYAHDIYVASFQPLLGTHWKALLGVIGSGVIVAWALGALCLRRHVLGDAVRGRLSTAVHWLPTAIVYIALALGLLKIYWLGWTDHYRNSRGYHVWHLAHAGWYGATASSAWMLVVYMGPFLVLAFLASLAWACRDPRVTFLRWFVAGFFVYVIVLQWVVPYSPYYARYLLSAVVPYATLLTVCTWSILRRGGRRLAFSIVMVVSLLYGAVLSAAQIGKNENAGARAALARIAAQVGPSDLILLDDSPGSEINQSEIKTPLIYTFDRAVATVGPAGLDDQGYLAKLASVYDDVFFVTSRKAPPPAGFSYVASSRFKVMGYQHNHSFPHRLLVARNYALYLYRRAHGWTPLGQQVAFANGSTGVGWLLSGWSRPESWGTWSDGNQAVLSIDPRAMPQSASGLTLRLFAKILVNSTHPVQKVKVVVDGETVARYVGRFPATRLTMDIPIGSQLLHSPHPVKIAFSLPNATSPAAIGINRDGRQLAIGLVAAQLLPGGPVKPSAQ